MAPKFGTSGVRGLVTELTDEVVTSYTKAFLSECDAGDTVYVGWDLRESSPLIAEVVMRSVQDMGKKVVNCGVLPTPALALAADNADSGAIMITGSHIPADRNGIKFYTRAGEISKADEAKIVASLAKQHQAQSNDKPRIDAADDAKAAYIQRYATAFGADALSGLRIGVYQHSSVARDILVEMVTQLGAKAIPLERTSHFVPVDTEAVDPTSRAKFAEWCETHKLDALISTDGDADRPMVTDHSGQIVPGDVLGVLTALYLKADTICTPVSSNSMIMSMDAFSDIHLTKIGSPFVVAAIEEVLAKNTEARVVGYEANGGFLLGYTHQTNAGELRPLLTRDCALPIVASLASAVRAGLSLAELTATLPSRFSAADRIAGIQTATSAAFLADLIADPQKRTAFFDMPAVEAKVDTTDGLRVTFANEEVVHLRPSGNAPEFRCYAEAETADRARALVDLHLSKVAAQLAS